MFLSAYNPNKSVFFIYLGCTEKAKKQHNRINPGPHCLLRHIFAVFAVHSAGKLCNTECSLNKMKSMWSLQMSDFCDILSYCS